MSTKIYTEKGPGFRSCGTVVKIVSTVKRLKCGQDMSRKSCPCSEGQPPVVAAQHHGSQVASRCSVNATAKDSDDYFEQWIKEALLEDGEHAGLFCMCHVASATDQNGLGGLATVKPEPKPRLAEVETAKNYDTDGQHSRMSDAERRTAENNNGSSVPAVEPETELAETAALAYRPAVDKKKRRKKKKGKSIDCTRAPKSADDVIANLNAKIKKLSQAVYPGVNCGHKNCIPKPVVTPRNIGWLWSLKETAGVKVKSLVIMLRLSFSKRHGTLKKIVENTVKKTHFA